MYTCKRHEKRPPSEGDFRMAAQNPSASSTKYNTNPYPFSSSADGPYSKREL